MCEINSLVQIFNVEKLAFYDYFTHVYFINLAVVAFRILNSTALVQAHDVPYRSDSVTIPMLSNLDILISNNNKPVSSHKLCCCFFIVGNWEKHYYKLINI